MSTSSSERRIWGLHPNVFFLGLVSLLTDVSSEMIFTLVPLFVANVLGASIIVVGLIGGLSDSTDAVFRIFSGWFSDRIGKRKLLSVLGYGISTVVKPFMYLATTWGATLAIRFGDRVGKGVRTSPRDALIAGSVGAEERGRSFGVHRAMDSAGAFLGLALAALIIYHLQGGGLDLTLNTYRWLVLVGTVPAVLAVLAHIFFTREVRQKPQAAANRAASLTGRGAMSDARFKTFLAIVAIFTLGDSGDFFTILRAQNLGVSVLHITLMLVLFNVVYVAFSVPSGILSDKLGRRRIIALGWFVYALVFLGFALAPNVWQVWVLFAAYGVYHGIVEGVARAFVADLVSEDKRGTAYGLYHGVNSLFLLPAGVIAGWMWEAISPAAPFYFGAALALLASVAILALMRE